MKNPSSMIKLGKIGLLSVYRNKRKSPDDFTKTKYYKGCSFCDAYHEYVANLAIGGNEVSLCKTCLTKVIETIDKQYIKDMKGDDRGVLPVHTIFIQEEAPVHEISISVDIIDTKRDGE